MSIIPDSRITNIRKIESAESLYESYCDEIEKIKIDDLSNNETWHYIESDAFKYKKILERLDEFKVLKEENHICDCGVGLGRTLFYFFQKTKEINKKFNFYGIEKEKHYIEIFERNLRKFWGSKIQIFNQDIMDHDYSKYNIVYTYTPFKSIENLKLFYTKVLNEIKPGSVLIEYIENGNGMDNCLSNLSNELTNIEKFQVGSICFFYKKEL